MFNFRIYCCILSWNSWISFLLQSAASLTNFLRSGFPFPQSSSPQDYSEDMKVPPIQLPTGMDRLPLPLPFSPDLLWRYPNPFMAQPPASPLESHVKSGLPGEICEKNQLTNKTANESVGLWCLFEFVSTLVRSPYSIN